MPPEPTIRNMIQCVSVNFGSITVALIIKIPWILNDDQNASKAISLSLSLFLLSHELCLCEEFE